MRIFEYQPQYEITTKMSLVVIMAKYNHIRYSWKRDWRCKKRCNKRKKWGYGMKTIVVKHKI